ncbi:hypothetical protein OKA05_18085 [Luteolibacter arcticus]|uniref:Uncharacterized protein n=1 Tax=Luteolibacter arcticus TaxID=1581411 RepID=A0ABT3GLX4_9BACT|nr:hypothetical protein [Luteolibacter arcticus]MCW1924482.1 hypothetical protein [Luteolibacter arcticus]
MNYRYIDHAGPGVVVLSSVDMEARMVCLADVDLKTGELLAQRTLDLCGADVQRIEYGFVTAATREEFSAWSSRTLEKVFSTEAEGHVLEFLPSLSCFALSGDLDITLYPSDGKRRRVRAKYMTSVTNLSDSKAVFVNGDEEVALAWWGSDGLELEALEDVRSFGVICGAEDPESVVIAVGEGTVYCLNARTRTVRWVINAGRNRFFCASGAMLREGKLYLHVENPEEKKICTVSRVDLASGDFEKVVELPPLKAWLFCPTGDYLFVGARYDEVENPGDLLFKLDVSDIS